MSEYNTLKETLKLDVALHWLSEDAKDDFYPDAIHWQDLTDPDSNYLERRKHRILQFDSIPYLTEHVPKANGMLRDAVWLPPSHRILYLATLRHLIARLDSKALSSVYSYRLNRPEHIDEHPFPNKIERWKTFQNDFREALLDSSSGAVLVTDLASFYDHISCQQLCDRIRALLGTTADSKDLTVIDFLHRLLNMWSTDGYGIPQNYDPSSFFGSLYLHNVDQAMFDRRYRYFRYVDDIRIVTKDKDEAVLALHDLQKTLAPYRLFLASNKTRILKKGDQEYQALCDVSDDKLISEVEDAVAKKSQATISPLIDTVFSKLQHHSGPSGDDRKFRAYGNRLLEIGDFEELREKVHPRLQSFVLPRLRSHPDRSDSWARLLSPSMTPEVFREIESLLVGKPSQFNWQRFHLWRLLLHSSGPISSRLLDKAIECSRGEVSDPVATQAILCVGKHGDNTQRENLFTTVFSPQRSYAVQRSVLISIQEIPAEQRASFYRRAIHMNSEHQELCEFLQKLVRPTYGEKPRQTKHCEEVPRSVEASVLRGIGLISGQKVAFRLSRTDYDYE